MAARADGGLSRNAANKIKWVHFVIFPETSLDADETVNYEYKQAKNKETAEHTLFNTGRQSSGNAEMPIYKDPGDGVSNQTDCIHNAVHHARTDSVTVLRTIFF